MEAPFALIASVIVSVVYKLGVWLILFHVTVSMAGIVFGQLLLILFFINRVFPGSPSVVISVLCHGQWLSGT